jgi:exodeoxyribonuclease VII large subunit
VVTGIGHEPDTSIADMVADVRASTPTAAAEAVAPDVVEVARTLDAGRTRLGRALTHLVAGLSHRLGLLADRPVFSSADALLATPGQTLDMLSEGLERALPGYLSRSEEAILRAREALARVGPRLTEHHASRLERESDRVVSVGRLLVEAADRDVGQMAARLEDLSPLAILGRGYAVCYEEDGAVLRSAADVGPGDRVDVRLAEGTLGCIVESVGSEG